MMVMVMMMFWCPLQWTKCNAAHPVQQKECELLSLLGIFLMLFYLECVVLKKKRKSNNNDQILFFNLFHFIHLSYLNRSDKLLWNTPKLKQTHTLALTNTHTHIYSHTQRHASLSFNRAKLVWFGFGFAEWNSSGSVNLFLLCFAR